MANNSILIVDDEPGVLRSLERQLKREKYNVYCAGSGNAGLNIFREQDIGVVLSDYLMPEMDGIKFLELIKHIKPQVVRILLTGYASMDNAVNAINRTQVFGYMVKPWSPEILTQTIANAFQHYNLLIENRRLQELTEEQNQQLNHINKNLITLVRERTSQLEEAINEGILMLAIASEVRNDDTGEHIYRIKALTQKICSALGMAPDESEKISFFSIMHDVGKIHIPDRILLKREPLNREEWEIMRTHCVVGEKILGNKPFYQTAREIARSHHECWDGQGYPDGLKGEEIPLSARIVSVADVFDALTHKRPFKEAWSTEKALDQMKSMSEKAFDPEILDAFIKTQSVGSDMKSFMLESNDGREEQAHDPVSG